MMKKGFVNEFKLGEEKVKSMFTVDYKPKVEKLKLYDKVSGESFIQLLTNEEVDFLLNEINKQDWIPVGINGMKQDYREGDQIGSYRLSLYEPFVADVLWDRMKDVYGDKCVFNEYSNTDHAMHAEWKPIGINPLFRFIRYSSEGALIPHYDWSYVESEKVRTLKTVIFSLEEADDGGDTRFLKDDQLFMTYGKRDLKDKADYAKESDIVKSIHLEKGQGFVFDHWILHDSDSVRKGQKTIVRTDILFEKVVYK